MRFRDFPTYSRRLLQTAFLTAAATLFPTTISAQINAEQVLTIGRNVLSMEDYMLAIQYFNQAIKAKPYLADPYFFRALAKLNLDDYKGAETDCTLALERNKFKSEAYKLRGFARQQMGLDSLAILDYNVGLDYDPTDKYFLFYKAVAQTSLEKYDDAEDTFASLLRQYPKFEEGFTARGRLNIQRGDTVAALSDLNQALALSKSLINPYLMRAEIEWARKEWDKAGEDMDAAIRLRPELPDLYVNRAFIRYNSDDFFGAMSDYNYTLELDPKNTAALFNRALLRYEVKDLQRAEEDLSAVLALNPANFHALYNRGLIRMEMEKNELALSDFNSIATKYPRFYPVYYAMAECKRNMGDMKSAMQLVYKADDLVKKYIVNPEANPLDKPTIAAAKTTDARYSGENSDSEMGDIEVMEKFNRLVTVSEAVQTEMSYNEKIKGRVQDRDVQVDIEPVYALSFLEAPASLKSVSNYFRELDDLNQQRLIRKQIHLNPGLQSISDEKVSEDLFAFTEDVRRLMESGKGRPVDQLALGIALTMLKNFPEAIKVLDGAIDTDPRFTAAYMARGFARYAQALADQHLKQDNDNSPDRLLDSRAQTIAIQEAISDYDNALSLNPRLVYAWFNKGNIYYGAGDFTSAIQCYSDALKIDPEFGEAYFNRGLSYLRAGNRNQAFADLSRAGELGVLPSYNILKRMH